MSNEIQKFAGRTFKTFWLQVLGIAVLIAVGIALVKWITNTNSVSVNVDQRIDVKSIFVDRELVRIYYGTLRLGIDLHKAKPQWLHVENDSIVVATLPNVELLDRNFIDEARTQSFFESGSWSADDKEKLYNIAYKKMLKRCFTKENIATAENNAQQQFEKMLKAMGYKNVRVEFEKRSKPK